MKWSESAHMLATEEMDESTYNIHVAAFVSGMSSEEVLKEIHYLFSLDNLEFYLDMYRKLADTEAKLRKLNEESEEIEVEE